MIITSFRRRSTPWKGTTPFFHISDLRLLWSLLLNNNKSDCKFLGQFSLQLTWRREIKDATVDQEEWKTFVYSWTIQVHPFILSHYFSTSFFIISVMQMTITDAIKEWKWLQEEDEKLGCIRKRFSRLHPQSSLDLHFLSYFHFLHNFWL
jgi:hypothetical protein